MEALAAENRRLRELLASSAQLGDQVLVAEIIAVNQDPYRHQITLNRGSRDGVYRGQALVDAYGRSEEHTSELQSLMRISYAVFCLKKKRKNKTRILNHTKPRTLQHKHLRKQIIKQNI